MTRKKYSGQRKTMRINARERERERTNTKLVQKLCKISVKTDHAIQQNPKKREKMHTKYRENQQRKKVKPKNMTIDIYGKHDDKRKP